VNTLLIEVIVLITIGWATTLYNWRRQWLRQQQAWQWWHQQQSLQSHHKAEAIRDGLLQQTFAFRRYLENTTLPASPDQTQRWLARFQTFYQSLETLSDDLSPPFIADSLPLALQFAIKNWQQGKSLSAEPFPAISNIQFSFPPDWPQGPPQQNQIILSTVTVLLPLLLPPERSPRQLSISLSRENAQHTLTLQLRNDTAQTQPNISELAEIQHLKEIFHSLTAGELEISQTAFTLTGRLCWRNDPETHPPLV
jgi:hypothetical protein